MHGSQYNIPRIEHTECSPLKTQGQKTYRKNCQATQQITKINNSKGLYSQKLVRRADSSRFATFQLEAEKFQHINKEMHSTQYTKIQTIK